MAQDLVGQAQRLVDLGHGRGFGLEIREDVVPVVGLLDGIREPELAETLGLGDAGPVLLQEGLDVALHTTDILVREGRGHDVQQFVQHDSTHGSSRLSREAGSADPGGSGDWPTMRLVVNEWHDVIGIRRKCQ